MQGPTGWPTEWVEWWKQSNQAGTGAGKAPSKGRTKMDNMKELLEKEAREHREWQRTTVVNEFGETIADLLETLNLAKADITDKRYGTWTVKTTPKMAAKMTRAAMFFDADKAVMIGEEGDLVIIQGHGYQAF